MIVEKSYQKGKNTKIQPRIWFCITNTEKNVKNNDIL